MSPSNCIYRGGEIAVYYPPEVVQEVQALNDIVDLIGGYVTLKSRAGSYLGLCPFHKEKTPSFSVSPDRQMFYCFGCGEGGNAIAFVMKIENLDFIESLKFLAERVHYTLPQKGTSPSAMQRAAERELSAELNKRAARFYHDHLQTDTPEAQNARSYLEERGVSPALVKRFGLGLSPSISDGLITHLSPSPPGDLLTEGLASQNKKDPTRFYDRFRSRLMFPIIDARGRVVAFGGRIMEESNDPERHEAKYINTPETSLFHKSDHLYGLNLAKKARAQEILIVEGYMDVLAMHQGGFINTVGVLGTALTDSHARILRQTGCKSVVLILDSDEAGTRAALRAIPILIEGGLKVRVLQTPEAKDPDEYLQRFGAQSLAHLISGAKSHISYQVELLRAKHDLDTTDGRVSFTQDAAEILAGIPSAIEADAYVSEIAKASDISPTAIQAEIYKISGKKVASPAQNRPIRPRMQPQNQERGLKDAKKGLLHLALTNPKAAIALENSDYLKPDELGDDIYEKLLSLSFKNAAENIQSAPANIFPESPDAQKAVAEIFTNPPQYSSQTDIVKALNEMAFTIKRSWVLAQMGTNEAKNDPNTLKILGFQARNMPSIGI